MPDLLTELRTRVEGLPSDERRRFEKRLRGAARVAQPERRRRILEAIASDLEAGEGRLAARAPAAPLNIRYPAGLPIVERRRDLLDVIGANQVVVVAGETGSGKSTQLPKMCLELGRGVRGMIGHTQPRRIAARTIAGRIAEELEVPLGGPVGYAVRFTDQVGADTMVKVMTDGILLAEIHRDPLLRRYDTIIVDEAHERSLNIDFLLGYLRQLLPRRPDLKVIVTSATIDTVRFSEHFGDAPVVEVSGRSYPVEVRYRPYDDPDEPDTQAGAIAAAVAELAAEAPGDILVFCAGEREIHDAADAVEALGLRDTEVLGLYARQSAAEQHRAFEPHAGRRVVIATNVAETSLTVPRIRGVVDAGTARISRYNRRTKVQRLPIEPISRASADQRAGRCGRVGPGVCVRLYSEDDYAARPAFTEPEVQRTNLASVILRMAALDLGDIEAFPFVEPPDRRAVRDGVALLEELGAVDAGRAGTDRWLTGTGRRLARMPVDPRIGRMVLEGDRRGCLDEVIVIAAALSVQDPRRRPKGEEEAADQAHAPFRSGRSDLLDWLLLWEHLRGERRERSARAFRRMCEEQFLDHRRVREWFDVHRQLREVAADVGLVPSRQAAEPEAIHRALLAGLLSQVGMREPDGPAYRGPRGARFWIAPGSGSFRTGPRWVMAADLVETTRLWARGVAPVAPEWIEEAAAHLVRRSHSEPWWDRRRGTAVATETVTLHGLALTADRVVPYGRVDVAAARAIFIRHALVEGDWDTHHRFAATNAERIAEVRELEVRERRADLLVDDDVLYAHFDARIPHDVTSARAFDAWWKGRTSAELELTLDELIDPAAAGVDEQAFPTELRYGDLSMPVSYEFDPASATDGVTVDVPVRALDRVSPSLLEWNVPGLREDLVTALVRSLPKSIRRELVPVPETVRAVLADLDESAGPVEAVRARLGRLTGLTILPTDFDLDRIPPHLLPWFRVVGDDGAVLAEGGDLAALRTTLREETRAAAAASRHPLEQAGLTSWTLDRLPTIQTIDGPAGPVTVYPALVDDGASVAVRLLATPDEQAEEMWKGTRRLLALLLPGPGGSLRSLLDDRARLVLRSGPHEGPAEWMSDCMGAAVDDVLADSGGPVWDEQAFRALLRKAKQRIGPALVATGRASLQVLEALRAALLAVEDTAPKFESAIDDVVDQLHTLVYPGFVTAAGTSRLPDLERYLRAVAHRLERLPANPDRDDELTLRVRALESEYDRLLAELPASPELVDLGWSLQELRVSLFAQSLGTRGTVSEQRIRRALDAAAR